MKSIAALALAGLFIGGIGLGCNEILDNDTSVLFPEPQAAQCVAGTLNLDIPLPTIVAPSPGDTRAGNVTFEWTGSIGPFIVELARDEQFTQNVQSIPAESNSLTLSIPAGGDLHWRVRSDSACGRTDFAYGGKLHVTGTPILLRNALDGISAYQPSIAWNPVDKEYGIVFVVEDAVGTRLEFIRTDAKGQILAGGLEKPISINVVQKLGTTPHPTIAYVSDNDSWAIVLQPETPSSPVACLIDDQGTVLVSPVVFLDAVGSKTHDVDYDKSFQKLIVSTSFQNGDSEGMYVSFFDNNLLEKASFFAIAGQPPYPQKASHGRMVAMSGFSKAMNHAVFTSFDLRFKALDGKTWSHNAFVERVDYDTSAMSLKWAWGFSDTNGDASSYIGKSVYDPQTLGVAMVPAMAWNEKDASVGIAMTLQRDSDPMATSDDVVLLLVDPSTGNAKNPVVLNQKVKQSAFPETPAIAWDNDEFLVMWNARDSSGGRQIRMSKTNGSGNVVSTGAQVFLSGSHQVALPGGSEKALVGHDGIHTFVFEAWDDPKAKSISLCIEPPYSH